MLRMNQRACLRMCLTRSLIFSLPQQDPLAYSTPHDCQNTMSTVHDVMMVQRRLQKLRHLLGVSTTVISSPTWPESSAIGASMMVMSSGRFVRTSRQRSWSQGQWKAWCR